MTRFAAGLVVLAAATTAPAIARAGTFAADGTFAFDAGAVATLDFEDDEPNDAGMPTTMDDARALSGKRVLPLAPFAGADVALTLPAKRATYRVSMWINGGEVAGDLELSYSGRVDEVAALFPTGRVTSDGWVELANDHVRVDGERLVKATIGAFSAGGAVIDAVELVPDGGADALPEPPNAACDGAATANACGVGQACVWSACRNVDGWVPPIPPDREDVAAYLTARIHLLFGPYLERTQDMPASDVLLDQMKQATDKYTYWSGFLAAVRRLHDGHTSTNGLADFVLKNPRPLAFCAVEGDADLTHDKAPKDPEYLDVLISHVGADHNLGLKPGDRIVRVDGAHPIAWARAMLPVSWSWTATSNHETYAELASTLRSLISRYARTIEVIRCDAGACGDVEAIDLAAIPLEDAPMVDPPDCDNRPLRHLADAPANHQTGESVYEGVVVESDATEAIHGLEWESMNTTTGADGVGPALKAAVAAWRAGARGVIMDHRTGFGGTILGPAILWDFSVPQRDDDIYRERTFAEEEQPSTSDGLAIFQAAVADHSVQMCGGPSPDTSVPVALLITEDVSASDWMPQGLKGAPNAQIFGPYQTNGGFSTRYVFGYWFGMGYVLATGDTFLADGTTHNGRGVEPDVVVLPKQSDLMAGKDSVYEAALAWVRGRLAP